MDPELKRVWLQLHDALSDIYEGENVPARRGGTYNLEPADLKATNTALEQSLELIHKHNLGLEKV